MELTLPAATLAREMSLMQGVVERRTPHQILSNVLLEAQDQTLTLTATDLDTTFVSEIESLSLKTGGAVTVPARRLFDVVRDLPATAEVRLRVLENHHGAVLRAPVGQIAQVAAQRVAGQPLQIAIERAAPLLAGFLQQVPRQVRR